MISKFLIKNKSKLQNVTFSEAWENNYLGKYIEYNVTTISMCFTRFKLKRRKTHNYVTKKQLIDREKVIDVELVTKLPDYVTRRSFTVSKKPHHCTCPVSHESNPRPHILLPGYPRKYFHSIYS